MGNKRLVPEVTNMGDGELFTNLPDKQYSIIYMDPPWKYKLGGILHTGSDTPKRHRDPYETLDIQEIAEIPIKDLCNRDCLVFVWTTSAMLSDTFKLFEDLWGFKYSSVAFVWVKNTVLSGVYTMPQTEFVLLFKLGKIPTPRGSRNQRQLCTTPRTIHSRKPIEIMDRITRMFPDLEKLEMFARNPRARNGWDFWGKEA